MYNKEIETKQYLINRFELAKLMKVMAITKMIAAGLMATAAGLSVFNVSNTVIHLLLGLIACGFFIFSQGIQRTLTKLKLLNWEEIRQIQKDEVAR